MNTTLHHICFLAFIALVANNSAKAQEKSISIENDYSSSPTIIIGKANTPNGTTTETIVEQPNSKNILGNPIPEIIEQPSSTPQPSDISKNGVKDTQTPSLPLPEGKFENTLMEANGMVYDIQAYPESDLPVIGNPSNPKTIYSPNVNP